jgi:uncharacterized protein (DUF58 family)
MRAIRRIEIRTSRLVNQGLGGEYHSVFKGRGMEFSEVREYQPGDDVRTIDWNVTSRTGHLHVKKFVEERELTVLLLVDVSRSGDFATVSRSKLETAAEVAAVLAFSAVRNNDRVGLVLFTDRVERLIPPARGGEHVLRVVREVLCHEPAGHGTDLSVALQAVLSSLRKRAVVFVLSDFLASGHEFMLRVASRKHDVVAIRVTDRREIDLPPMGLVEVEDAETGDRRLVDLGRRDVREAWQRAAAGARAEHDALVRRIRIDALDIATHVPYDLPIMKFFRARERRRRRS